MTRKQFIAALKKAKASVEKGTASCGGVGHCHHCALGTAGVFNLGYKLEGYRGKKDEWSFRKSKEQVLALFDNSIKALETEVQ